MSASRAAAGSFISSLLVIGVLVGTVDVVLLYVLGPAAPIAIILVSLVASVSVIYSLFDAIEDLIDAKMGNDIGENGTTGTNSTSGAANKDTYEIKNADNVLECSREQAKEKVADAMDRVDDIDRVHEGGSRVVGQTGGNLLGSEDKIEVRFDATEDGETPITVSGSQELEPQLLNELGSDAARISDGSKVS